MKRFPFLLLVIAVVFKLGCNAENPVCTTNFCAVGEIFPRSELEDGQAFSEVDIDDSVIFATLAGTMPTSVEPEPTSTVTFADVVADVAAGSRTYVGKTVSVTASVEEDTSNFRRNDTITLQTNNDDVWFFVLSRNAPEKLQGYEKGQSYTFKVFIVDVDPPEPFSPEYDIWSYLSTESVSTTMDAIVADVAAGGTTYLEQIVSIRATVDADTQVFFDEDDDYETISLITNNEKVLFFVNNERYPPAELAQYQGDDTYDFKLFIYSVTDSTVSDRKFISAAIVLD